jgi:hypothetical protein
MIHSSPKIFQGPPYCADIYKLKVPGRSYAECQDFLAPFNDYLVGALLPHYNTMASVPAPFLNRGIGVTPRMSVMF